MFGRRKREEAAAAEVAREAERRALFAKLAERPEHICPFLGLEGDRAGYVDGVSDEHRCFAFGDPAPISAEQQTRVCQERGYGNCPRYLRGVLVIPTEELEALRRPREAIAPPAAAAAAAAAPERRRRAPVFLLLALLLLVGGGGAGAYLLFGRDPGTAITPSPSATAAPSATIAISPSPSSVPASVPPSPTPEPTPEPGDEFAFYEVAVGPPDEFTLFRLDADGEVVGQRTISFDGFSFAQVDPTRAADGIVYWITAQGQGDLAGYGYTFPESGDFRIRAVFLSEDGSRRSAYLEGDELTVLPEGAPAPGL